MSTCPILSRVFAWFVLCLESTVSSLVERAVTDRFWYFDATTIKETESPNSQMIKIDPRMTGLVHMLPPSDLLLPLVNVSVKKSCNMKCQYVLYICNPYTDL